MIQQPDPLVAALAQLVRERHELEQRRRREQQERRAKMAVRVIDGRQGGKAA